MIQDIRPFSSGVKKNNEKRGRQKILLRIYLCFDTDNQITLLSGYDKGADPSRKRQTDEIQKALNLRDEWRERNA
jgi:hypothetical protein